MEGHPRTQQVMRARNDVQGACLALFEKHGLTYIESVQALTDTLALISRHELRGERHPNDPDKGADEA